MAKPNKTFTLTTPQRRALIGAAVLLPLCGWAVFRASCVGATPGGEEPPPAVSAPAPLPTTVDAGVPALPLVIPTTATLVFQTVPSTAHATVSWGKKKLGRIEPGKPLVVVRPRDSGPLDVTVRADGYLPVHTRAYTFNDGKILVKLTKPTETSTLLGYRVPVDAGAPPGASLDEEPAPPGGPAMPPTLF
ncbi:MAG: hypothetical protein JWN48_4360 [Myxococcaceae bacterium]|nr:hypothetical protein [Myxococcaceae bacterium]